MEKYRPFTQSSLQARNNAAVTLFIFAAALAYGQQHIVTGTWYRDDLFTEATLSIDSHLSFKIGATHTAHDGESNGSLTKVTDGVYFAKVDDSDVGQACLMGFLIENDRIEVKLLVTKWGPG